MRNLLQLSGILLLCTLLHSCGLQSNGYIYTLYTESFVNQKKASKKIILINPDFKAYASDLDEDDQNFEKSLLMRKTLIEKINRYSKESGYNYDIISSDGKKDVGTDFFTELLPLRQAIFQAISNQDNPLNEITSASYRRVARQQFVVNTLIPAEMSELEKKYGTPYFSILEVYSAKNQSYIIHIIADVSRGVVSYQEIKRYNGEIKKRLITPLIFDTFDSLKRI